MPLFLSPTLLHWQDRRRLFLPSSAAVQLNFQINKLYGRQIAGRTALADSESVGGRQKSLLVRRRLFDQQSNMFS
jgi:hypothetical protein